MNTILLLALLPLLYHIANADPYNITEVIGQDPRFSTFNSYLTDTGIAAKINSRQGITVLVVNNHAMELLAGKPKDVVRKIMSVHVLLKFYDIMALQSLPERTNVPVTTLFQETGQAVGDQGILHIYLDGIYKIYFTSGPSGGSGMNVKSSVVNKLIDHAYYLSVVEITNLIIPPGIENPPPAAATPQPPHQTLPQPPHETGPATPQPPHETLPQPPHETGPATPQPPNVVTPPHENVPSLPKPPSVPAPPQQNAPSSPQAPGVSAPPQEQTPASPQPPSISVPPQANTPASSQNPRAPTPSQANAPGSTQISRAPAPSQENAPGSPQISRAPAPSQANVPGSPQSTSEGGAPDSSKTNNSPSPSPSHAGGPGSAPELSPSESPAESPEQKSDGVRIASTVSFNAVLATRLSILAVLWMI